MKSDQQEELRTHEDAVLAGYNAFKGKELTNTKGLKGLSIMLAFKYFNGAKSFPIDWMHGICVGVVPLMVDIWLGKKKTGIR